MLLAALETPSILQFTNHPDFPTVAAFFFGWVFYASLCALLTSPQLKGIIMYFHTLLLGMMRQPSTVGVKDSARKLSMDDTSSIHALSSRGDSLQHTLILMLFLSLLTGSLANFISLLSFNSNGEFCAFTVAWGLLSTETARLMGLFVLLLTLRHLGMKRWELIVSLIWLAVGLVFVFIDAALATSVTQRIDALSISLCFRRHFLPAAVVSTAMYLILELFVVIRLWSRIPRDPLQRRSTAKLFDIRILRALSLVVLNLLTAVPSAIVTNTLADSIPYSIGAIGVLLAFSHEADDWSLTNGRDSPDLSPSFEPSSAGLPVSARDVAQRFTPPTFSTWVPHHPYSANSLGDPELLQPWDEEHQASRTARSTRTIDSSAARSIRDAVIQQARIEQLPARSSANDTPRTILDPQGDAEGAQQEPRKPPQTLKSLRPKLVIVTRTSGPEVVPTSERRRSLLSSLQLDTVTSRFSSPSVTTADSRSTISYPVSARTPTASGRRVLSFSSMPHDGREVPSVALDERSTESESHNLQDGIAAMEQEARIVTNPGLLAPVASPSGPRVARMQFQRQY